MKKIFIKLGLILSAMVFIVACSDDDDFTGHSNQTATSPSLSVSLDFDNNQTLVEAPTSYGFTVTLSEPQIVNVVAYLSQTGGTATPGEDFEFPSQVVIPKGSTSASDVIKILSDDLVEGTETATIKIVLGNEANVSGTSSETVNFSIMNLTAGDLAVGMSWANSSLITDTGGNEIDPTDAADLILEIRDASGTAIHTSDGASFESTTLEAADPDGEYFVVGSFYAATDTPALFDLTATFDQVGVINHLTYDFAEALSNAATCGDNYFTLAKITKSGESYTIEEVGEGPTFDFATTWTGSDATGLDEARDSAITTADFCGSFYAHGINKVWMEGFWGEEIQTEADVFLSVAADGTVTIAPQYIFTTLYDGDMYDYTISGSGTFDEATGELTLQYFLDQEGFSPSNWAFDNGYLPAEYFEAIITRD